MGAGRSALGLGNIRRMRGLGNCGGVGRCSKWGRKGSSVRMEMGCNGTGSD